MTLLDHLTSQAFIDATTVTGADGRTHDLDLCCEEHVEAIIAAVLDAARGAVAGALHGPTDEQDCNCVECGGIRWALEQVDDIGKRPVPQSAFDALNEPFPGIDALRAAPTATARDIADDRAEHDARDRGEGR